MRIRALALSLLGTVAALSAVGFTASPAMAQATPAAPTPAAPTVSRSCTGTARPGLMSCFALRRTNAPAAGTMSAMATPSGYGPTDLRSAYKLGADGGTGATVAIVDAYDNPKAESDLATYRAQFGLPACTTANGCFRKVNQNGAASPLPTADQGWAGEISLDLDMVSAICPNCGILLVEANSAYDSDLFVAEDRAVTMGAKFVSNSWGGDEFSGQTSGADAHFNHPGVAITASTGDNGTGAAYPATSRYVTAVGGTSLSRAANARGFTESAWSGAGSGCSAYDAKPSWQTVATGCAKRAESDVSAVADPGTGVAVYALAGNPGANDYPAAYPYAHQGNLFDVTSGNNGSCGPALCTAGTGWDGPTGLGTPNGTAAFLAGTAAPAPVAVTAPGNQAGTVGAPASVSPRASGGTGTYTWTATGLPTGLALNATTGVVSGTPTVAGNFSVTVTATSGGQSGRVSFAWTVAPAPTVCTAGQLFGNAGLESGTTPWSATAGVVSATGDGETPHSGTHYGWLAGYGTTHTDTLSQTVTLPAGCRTATLSFWLKISSQDTGTVAHDTFTVKVGSTVLATYTNLNRAGYVQKSFNLNGFLGQRVTITFTGTEDARCSRSPTSSGTSAGSARPAPGSSRCGRPSRRWTSYWR
ncbi:MAG: hypothetical protein AUI14_14085 [Actinobacteria bacterium 13_2_20CM_2_71_6]|nr:MAG: hypothetical protein AUI14_14085 [Actinobacteria bacterium 13_2_20CM_2_71_6]